ncbi:MAG: hypothetical protein E7263_08125, partial [Lachnospiraceae bacterium]|nr:hypothetical protein [Lachnospiraceae bacterium]
MKRRVLKKLILNFICLIISFNMVLTEFVVYANEFCEKSEITLSEDDNMNCDSTINDLTISGDGSLGNLINKEISDELNVVEESEDYKILSVSVEERVATVEFNAADEAELIVAIYDNEGITFVASGTENVTKEESVVDVIIDIDSMPEYFFVRAYLVEEDTLKPLSDEFECNLYTQSMMEFLQKTPEDFDDKNVLVLEEETNNYLVYNDNTKVIPYNESYNTIESIDDVNYEYVISNPDEEFLNLVPGEVFSYEFGDGNILVVDVENIQQIDDKLIITGSDVEIEDVFDYVHIDGSFDMSDCEIDNSNLDEDVVVADDTSEVPLNNSSIGSGIEVNIKPKKYFIGKKDNNGDIQGFYGSVDFKAKGSFKLIKNGTDSYIELKLGFTIDADIGFAKKIKKTYKKLGKLEMNLCPGVKVSFTPSVVLEAEGELHLGAYFEMDMGIRADFGGVKNISKKPYSRLGVELDGKIFFGLSFKPELKVANGKVCNIDLTAEIGVELEGSTCKPVTENYKKHSCTNCVEGELKGILDINGKVKLFDLDWFEFKVEFVKVEIPIGDFYFSVDHIKFGLGECPYITYKILASVVDQNYKGISGVSLYGKGTTDANGDAIIWLKKGKYSDNLNVSGYTTSYVSWSGSKKLTAGDDSIQRWYYVLTNGTDSSSSTSSIKINKTNFPDTNFRLYVLDNIDKDGNGKLSKSEIDGTKEIDCSNKNINSLTGIDVFYNLEELHCDGNKLKQLDVSKCLKLVWLTCDDNDLTTLNLDNCNELDIIHCSNNSLVSIDLGDCTSLSSLYCDENKINTLDLSKCTKLTNLTCNNNNLSILNLNNCKNLKSLYCHENNISTLNISNCTYLTDLFCRNNNLTTLDVSKCTRLVNLTCGYNKLNSLNLNYCTALTSITCNDNNFSTLDVSKCTKLDNLSCGSNNLTVLDVSKLTKLKNLSCANNNLSALSLNNCVYLESLYCYSNNLNTLDVSKCTKLKYLSCDDNNLSVLGLNNCVYLESLNCEENSLSSLDVSKCTKLNRLICSSNDLTSLTIGNCSNLNTIYCCSNELSDLDVSQCPNLEYLVCGINNITILDLSNNTKLRTLDCDSEVTVVGYTKAKSVSLNASSSATDIINLNTYTGTSSSTYEDADANTYTSNITEAVKTVQKVTTADDNHVDYYNLYPNEIYNLYIVKESTDDMPFVDVLNSDNILYIKQYTSDENGELSIDYSSLLVTESATEILVSRKRINISEGYEISIKDLEYIGEEQEPVVEVKYNGQILIEGKDYVLLGDIKVTDIADYTITVKGIGIYEGDIDIPYSVIEPFVNIENIVLDNSVLSMKIDDTQKLNATISPSGATDKTLAWSSSDETVAIVDSTGIVTALKAGTTTITATANDGSGVLASCMVTVTEPIVEEPDEPTTDEPDQPKSYPTINTSYRTHIQSFGWEGNASDITTWKANGTMSGTSGKAKRLEGINIVVNSAEAGKDVDLGIQYTTHCQSYGWLPWSADGDMNGTEGEAKRLEAIKIQLTGADKDAYDVYYRVHAQSYGWLNWAKNGAPSGTAGYGKRLEGIQIVVVKKGEAFNQKMEG